MIDAVRKHQQKSGMHTRLGLALFLFELGEPLRPYRVSGTNKKPIFVVLNPQPPFVSIFFPSWRCQCNAYLVWVRKACDAMPR